MKLNKTLNGNIQKWNENLIIYNIHLQKSKYENLTYVTIKYFFKISTFADVFYKSVHYKI